MESQNRRIVVTGLGVVSPIGDGREPFCEALLSGRSGMGPVSLFDMSSYRTQLAGEVPVRFPEMALEHNADRTVSLAFRALTEALADSGLTPEQVAGYGKRAGLAFATSLGGTPRVVEHIRQEIRNEEPDPALLTDLNLFVNFIVRKAGVHGPCITTVSACAAGTASAGAALDLMRFGRTDLMILGGSDPLTELSVGGFHALKSLSPSGKCKPFDRGRDGLTIGEGSAFFVLELLEHAEKRGAHIYAEVLGYGISNDGYHITSPDPAGGGAIRAMQMALEDARIGPECVDYINAHGTATLVNDKMELKAIAKVFGEHASRVAISSTKSLTGHCLGAAGSIEMAASLLAIDRGFYPPTATLEVPEEEFATFNLIRGMGVRADVRVVMSNSFAFAGNAACVVLRRVDRGVDRGTGL